MGGAGPARRRAGMGRKARRLPEPRSVLDPWGFERALRILGWGPAPLVVATGFAQRLLGMTTRREGTVVMGFPSCSSVHTCFMTRPLDIAFIDSRGRVLELHEGVRPWRFLRCRGASSVIERVEDPEARFGPGRSA